MLSRKEIGLYLVHSITRGSYREFRRRVWRLQLPRSQGSGKNFGDRIRSRARFLVNRQTCSTLSTGRVSKLQVTLVARFPLKRLSPDASRLKFSRPLFVSSAGNETAPATSQPYANVGADCYDSPQAMSLRKPTCCGLEERASSNKAGEDLVG